MHGRSPMVSKVMLRLAQEWMRGRSKQRSYRSIHQHQWCSLSPRFIESLRPPACVLLWKARVWNWFRKRSSEIWAISIRLLRKVIFPPCLLAWLVYLLIFFPYREARQSWTCESNRQKPIQWTSYMWYWDVEFRVKTQVYAIMKRAISSSVDLVYAWLPREWAV